MSNRFKELFSFTRTERNGIMGLFIMIVLLILLRQIFFWTSEESNTLEYSVEWEKIKDFEKSLSTGDKSGSIHSLIPDYDTLTLFYFNPNKATEMEWKKLGLVERQIKTIKNYQASGGRFFQAEDLEKIYGLTAYQLKQIKPYVRIFPKNKHKVAGKKIGYMENNKGKGKNSVKSVRSIIEINTASSEDLKKIPGIGPVFSQRIVKYRDLLGGFHRKTQLLEVYGLSDSLYFSIISYIEVDTQKIVTWDINTADEKRMGRHPYLTQYEAKAIVAYRSFRGTIHDISEIKKNQLINQESYQKIRPYLRSR